MNLPIIFLSRKKWEELNKKVSENQKDIESLQDAYCTQLELICMNGKNILRNKSEVSDLRKSLKIAINERLNKSIK